MPGASAGFGSSVLNSSVGLGSSAMFGHSSSATSQLVNFLSGRLRYRGKDRTELASPFGAKDTRGSFTMQ